MDGEDRLARYAFVESPAQSSIPPDLCTRFIAQDFRGLDDADHRRARLAGLVSDQIAPRLAVLHAEVGAEEHPTLANIAELARLVLSPEGVEAAAYVTELRDRGLSVDVLFAELLEPAAQRLGELWDEDEIDFIDVTLGVGRLQALLSVFNCTQQLAASDEYRSVLMLTVPGEQHSFGVAMVERFLEAGGWQVAAERETCRAMIAEQVQRQWFAVAGLTLSNHSNLHKVAAMITAIREHSRNPSIGIMVGGPVFSAQPGLASAVGADGTATSGPTAVVLAQKLLDAAIAAQHPERRAQGRPSAGSAARSAS